MIVTQTARVYALRPRVGKSDDAPTWIAQLRKVNSTAGAASGDKAMTIDDLMQQIEETERLVAVYRNADEVIIGTQDQIYSRRGLINRTTFTAAEICDRIVSVLGAPGCGNAGRAPEAPRRTAREKAMTAYAGRTEGGPQDCVLAPWPDLSRLSRSRIALFRPLSSAPHQASTRSATLRT